MYKSIARMAKNIKKLITLPLESIVQQSLYKMKKAYMNGLKDVSNSFSYARFLVSFCDSSKSTFCSDKESL